jgi:hypothetical protein
MVPVGSHGDELDTVRGKAALIEPVVEPMASSFATRSVFWSQPN